MENTTPETTTGTPDTYDDVAFRLRMLRMYLALPRESGDRLTASDIDLIQDDIARLTWQLEGMSR